MRVVGAFRSLGRGYSSPSTEYGRTFEKILVANRGEIACRVMKTAKKMGIKTVAVYSEADAHALHVEMADEAGPPPSSKSYLNIEAILAAVRKTGAQAVHPGYGFLSENFKFCQALDEHGVTFIGPSVSAMAQMGDKIESKIIAKDAGVHTIPGFNGVVENEQHAMKIAKEIGYPVMIKASAGGGGKGMRIAWNEDDVKENFKIAATESKASFGDDRLLIEKYIEEPRHIEIQLIGDRHGNTLYLPERECSIQRRNQKVIEEAPSMALDPDTRRRMGEQAIQLAKRVGYFSAGTVEFLVDKHRHFYFLEMNTRLQVEHPITEYITGIDLVEQMIRVAAGQKLVIKQSDVKINGWAFESRVYAEDPKLFLPSIGRLHKYVEPLEPGNPEIRCDSGIREGSEISIYYDPLICKLCTHAPERMSALRTMNRALDSYVIRGVTHNIPLIREVLSQKRFQRGEITTKYLPEEFPQGFPGHSLTKAEVTQLALTAVFVHARRAPRVLKDEGRLFVRIEGVEQDVGVEYSSVNGKFKVATDNAEPIELELEASWKLNDPLICVKVQGQDALTVQYHGSSYLGQCALQAWGTVYDTITMTALERDLIKYMPARKDSASEGLIKAPMAGQIVSLSAKVGDVVREGADIAVIEAMKMQNVLRAPKAGTIKAIHIEAGQNVSADQSLVEIEFL